jgi:hypothetical protein
MMMLDLLLATAIAVNPVASNVPNYGKFVGTVKVEWLDDGRRMRLIEPFMYVDPKGGKWHAPIGSVVDGASIPQLAWTIAGGPFEGKYREASVIHDVACDEKVNSWEWVHEVFYWGMMASGVNEYRALTMYAAVHHLGPRWPRTVTVQGFTMENASAARATALMQADRGSRADILAFRPAQASYPPRPAEIDIRITPLPARLSAAEFEELKQRIEERERTQTRISLDEIRAFQPQIFRR